jgi:hypothetical protein
MKRLSKLVAVLALSGAVANPATFLFAHSACAPSAKGPARGCHAIMPPQSGAAGDIRAAEKPCCRIAPSLPAKTTTYAPTGPATSLAAFHAVLPSPAWNVTRSTPANFVHAPPHRRAQAVLCSFLI